MTEARAITGQLVDAKNIAVHKSMRLSIDVPAEMGAEIVKLFGWPTMAQPVPVAVARLAEPAQIEAQAESQPDGERRRWASLSLAQQAGIRCGEPAFQKFLREHGQSQVSDDKGAAAYVRLCCGVRSRADLDTKAAAGRLWRDLNTRFETWMREPVVA